MLSGYAAAAWTKNGVRSGEAWGLQRKRTGWTGGCNAAGSKSTRATGPVLVCSIPMRLIANASPTAKGALDGEEERKED